MSADQVAFAWEHKAIFVQGFLFLFWEIVYKTKCICSAVFLFEFLSTFPFYGLNFVIISFLIMLMCQALEPPSEEAVRSAISLLYEVLRFCYLDNCNAELSKVE